MTKVVAFLSVIGRYTCMTMIVLFLGVIGRSMTYDCDIPWCHTCRLSYDILLWHSLVL